jgi:hypothetical protein
MGDKTGLLKGLQPDKAFLREKDLFQQKVNKINQK